MRKPVIGVMPLMDVERESYWMLPGYMEGILEAGGIPVMFPLTPDRAVLGQLAESCDGFLLPADTMYRRKSTGRKFCLSAESCVRSGTRWKKPYCRRLCGMTGRFWESAEEYSFSTRFWEGRCIRIFPHSIRQRPDIISRRLTTDRFTM